MPEGLHTIDVGVYGAASLYDTASLLIFAAFTTPPDSTRKGVIDTCVRALKTAGLWTKFDVLYLFAAADSQAALINWKNPGTYNGTLVNAPAFVADRGYTGASTKYIDSGFNPSTAPSPNFVRDSATLMAWSRSNIDVTTAIIGPSTSTGSGESMIIPRNSPNLQTYVNQGSANNWANSDSSGMILVTRRGASSLEAYRNTTSLGTGTTASVAPVSQTLVFLKRGAANYWTGQIAGGGFASQFSAGEVSSAQSALGAYMTSVGA